MQNNIPVPGTISIIIPVYNVERFLNRCVESVLSQSYQNLEVILVDDGSPDNSGPMCDRWAEKDHRIRVIHKENGGISDARNSGIDMACGEYLVFIDSDDYIAPDMVQKLYNSLKGNDADISICNFLYIDENGIPLPSKNRFSPLKNETITGLEAIKRESDYHHKGWYYLFAWNKLYKKELFSEIRYPKGKLCEDDFIAHKLFQKCGRVSCITDVGYYYTQRPNSILHSRNPLVFLHQTEARLDRAHFCYTINLLRSSGLSYWIAAMSLSDASNTSKYSPEQYKEYKDIRRVFCQDYHMRKHCTARERLQILLVYLSPSLYRILFRNPAVMRLKALLRIMLGKQ